MRTLRIATLPVLAALAVGSVSFTGPSGRLGIGAPAGALEILGCGPPFVGCLVKKLNDKVKKKMSDLLGFNLSDLKKILEMVVGAGKCIVKQGVSAVRSALSNPGAFFKNLLDRSWAGLKTIGLRLLKTLDVRHLWNQIKGYFNDLKKLMPKELSVRGMVQFAADAFDRFLVRVKGEAERIVDGIWSALLAATRSGPAPLGCLRELATLWDKAKVPLKAMVDKILVIGRKVFKDHVAPRLAKVVEDVIEWLVQKVLINTKLGQQIKAALGNAVLDQLTGINEQLDKVATGIISDDGSGKQIKDEFNRVLDGLPFLKIGFWVELIKQPVKDFIIEKLNYVGDKVIYEVLSAIRAVVVNLVNKLIGWFTGTAVPAVVESATSGTALVGVGSWITSASSTIGEILTTLVRWVWDKAVDPAMRWVATFVLRNSVDFLVNGLGEYLYKLVKKHGIDRLDALIQEKRTEAVNKINLPGWVQKVLTVLSRIYKTFVAPVTKPLLAHLTAMRDLVKTMFDEAEKAGSGDLPWWLKKLRRLRRPRFGKRCKLGQVRDGRRCKRGCPEGKEAVQGVCRKACPSGKERVGRRCRARCKNGRERVGNRCLKPCRSGKERVNDRCVKACGPGEERVGSKCFKPCKSNEERVGGYCKRKCRDGQERIGKKCRNKCGSGQERYGDTCRPLCRSGEVRVGEDCLKRCEPGRVRVGKRCSKPCPSSQERVGSQCLKRCATGWHRLGNVCVKDCKAGKSCNEKCPTGWEKVGGICRKSCPANELRSNRGCVKECGYGEREVNGWCQVLSPTWDSDGDGIPDRQDKCPDDFGERGFQGCPSAGGR